MKRLFFWVVIISLTIFMGIQADLFGNDPSAKIPNQQKVYLDLTKDPVNPNGVSALREKQLLSKGWIKKTLPRDIFAYQVQFKDSNGKLYRKDGWVKAGTVFYLNKSLNDQQQDDDALFRPCSNVYSYWRWQVRNQ